MARAVRASSASTCGSATDSACSGRRRLEIVGRRVQPDEPHELRRTRPATRRRREFLVLTAYSTSYTPRKVQIGARFEF